MIFASVDPGSVNAALAVFHDGEAMFVDDLRTAGDMIDSVSLARALTDMKVQHLVVENVHSMPKQGVASTFRFGMGCGIIHGVGGALRLPMTLVTPSQWKKHFNLNTDKEASRVLALRMWPTLHARLERKKDSNRAEALLIGAWWLTRSKQ